MLCNARIAKRRLIQLCLTTGLLILCIPVGAQRAVYRNPVIAGDFPDPSVIRVGNDY